MRNLKVFAIATLFTAHSSVALAGGGPAGGGASEMTQMMNNAELINSVGQQAGMNAKLLQQYLTQYQQLQTMQQNLASMNPSAIMQALGPNAGQAAKYVQAYQASNGLAQSADQLSRLLTADYKSMRANNMTPQQYYSTAAAAAAQGNTYWQGQIKTTSQSMQDLQQKNQAVQDIAARNPEINGNVKGLQMISAQNAQMSSVLIEMAADTKQMLLIAQKNEAERAAKSQQTNGELDARNAEAQKVMQGNSKYFQNRNTGPLKIKQGELSL